MKIKRKPIKIPAAIILLIIVATAILIGCNAFESASTPADAAPLVLFEEAAEPGSNVRNDAAVERVRFVRLAEDALQALTRPDDALVAGQHLAVLLELFPPETTYTAELEGFSKTENGYSWTGTVTGVSSGQVFLAVSDDIVVGSIHLPGKLFSVEHAGEGIHAVYELDAGAFPPD